MNKENNANQTYSKSSLLESKFIGNDLWIATVALKDNKKYTLEEAQAVIANSKKRRVK